MTFGTLFLTHGVEGRRDLPLPLDLLVQGGVLALLASFFGLGLLWRSPRLRAGAAGRPVPLSLERLVDGTGFRWLLRLFGLLGTAYVLATAVLVGDDGRNPLPYVVYVLFWVGIVPLSVLCGPVWRRVNPLRTIHALLAGLTRIPADRGLVALPRWVGYWPAALSLLSFVWLELAAPDRDAVTVLLAYLGSYAAVHVGAALLFGDRWFATCDGFEVYSAVVGTMSPLGRRDDGRLVVRNPLDGAATFGPAPGVVVLIAVLLGSTFFDTISGSAQWTGAIQSVPVPATLLDTAGLLVMIGLVAVTFVGATLLAGRAGNRGRRPVPGLLAHTITTTGIALVQVIAVVVGHVLAVISAHDRSVALFPQAEAIIGQLPLMVLMVGYTVSGLTLLFAA